MNSVFQVLAAGYTVLVGVWCLSLMFGTSRETPMSFRVGVLLSGVSFMTYGILALLGELDVAWAKPGLIVCSLVPCLLSGVFAWVSAKKAKQNTGDNAD